MNAGKRTIKRVAKESHFGFEIPQTHQRTIGLCVVRWIARQIRQHPQFQQQRPHTGRALLAGLLQTHAQ